MGMCGGSGETCFKTPFEPVKIQVIGQNDYAVFADTTLCRCFLLEPDAWIV